MQEVFQGEGGDDLGGRGPGRCYPEWRRRWLSLAWSAAPSLGPTFQKHQGLASEKGTVFPLCCSRRGPLEASFSVLI